MSKKIIYEFDEKTLFGITHPGLETGFINEVNKWLRAKSQVLAHGFVLVKCKNLEELIYLLTKIRTPLMFGIPIFVCELEKVTESEILSCIKEAHQTFENFINNHNLEGLSIAFRGIRRSFRWLEKQVFKHDFTSVRLAKITADELLKSYSFKVNLKKPDITFVSGVFGNLFFILWAVIENANKARKYRKYVHPAGLSPSAAASAVFLREEQDLHDPMCGCGTIPIEAFCIYSNFSLIAEVGKPVISLLSKVYGIEQKTIINEIKEHIKTPSVRIAGSDISEKYIKQAMENYMILIKLVKQYVNLQYDVKFFTSDILHRDPNIKTSRILVNAPYGIRSSRIKVLPRIYSSLATFAYKACANYLDVFTAKPDILTNALKNCWMFENRLKIMLGDLLVSLILSRRSEYQCEV